MSKQIVEQVKAMLVARGQRWETNEDAFQITGRVAWILRGAGAMLIGKNASQNGAYLSPGGTKVSHDAIAFPGGQWKDCLISAGPADNFNIPTWDTTGAASGAWLLDPWDMDLVALPGPPAPPVEPEEPEEAPWHAQAQVDRIEAKLDLLLKAFEEADGTDPIYDIPYNVKAPWPIGTLKGSITATPRKR